MPASDRKMGFPLVVLVLLVVTAATRGLLLRPTGNLPGAHYNRSANTAWMDVVWLLEPHSEAEIAQLADELHRLQVRYVYLYASYLRANGEFNPTYSYAPQVVAAMKGVQPDLNVQAWIGLPLAAGNPLGGSGGHVRLSDPDTRRRIAEFCRQLLEFGAFDGIHLDPEPISSGDTNVLALLEDVRSLLRPGADLSLATRHIQPLFPDVQPWPLSAWFWSAGYYREIARRVDQIALMTYDSSLPLPEMYRLWNRLQVVELTRALADTDVDLLIGIPTSEERTTTHRPEAENMKSGLLGTLDGLNDRDAHPAAVTGVAIYPHWETDAAEWALYESLRLGHQ